MFKLTNANFSKLVRKRNTLGMRIFPLLRIK